MATVSTQLSNKPRVGLLYKQEHDFNAICDQIKDFEVVDLSEFCRELSEPKMTALDNPELAATIRNCDILVTWLTTPKLPQSLSQNLGKLKYICHTRGVLKEFFPRFLMEQGVRITNWGDERAWIVGDKVLAILLCLNLQALPLDRHSRGENDTRILPAYPDSIKGFKVGLYGCGQIGLHFCKLALALGMEVMIYDPFLKDFPANTIKASSLKELFSKNYAVSIHAGLNKATKYSINAEMLSYLPKGGILINTARGDIIDEDALEYELKAGRLMAGLDVLSDEENWSESRFTQYSNCLLTQHGIRVPGFKEPTFILPDYAVHNIHAFLNHLPLKHEIMGLSHFDRTT